MPVCIYCKIEKLQREFSHREHVIPQAFGKFEPINFILNENDKYYVCNACNSDFGNHIDRWLAKDTVEGYVLRSKYFKETDVRKRIRTNLTVADGEYKGLQLEFIKRDSLRPVKQYGFIKHDDTWEYFTPDNLDSLKKDQFKLRNSEIRVFRLSDAEIKNHLASIEITFKGVKSYLNKPVTFPNLLCNVHANIDKVIFRAVSKIAFNYFSYFNHKDTILQPNFDNIRDFILTGFGDIPIRLSGKPILVDEGVYGRLGHIITLERNNFGYIIAHVSLYNYLQYSICIGSSDRCENLNTGFGHYFDMDSKKISDVCATSVLVPKIEIIKPKFGIIIPSVNLWLPK